MNEQLEMFPDYKAEVYEYTQMSWGDPIDLKLADPQAVAVNWANMVDAHRVAFFKRRRTFS